MKQRHRRPIVPMLNRKRRKHYERQNGGRPLTARQLRRIRHNARRNGDTT